MPDPAMAAALAEAYASAPSSDVILHTLELNHASFSAPIRVVRDNVDHTCTLESTAPHDPSTAVTFVAFAFDFTPPEVSDSAAPEITIAIDNVSSEIVAYIDQAAQTLTPVTVIYRPFLSGDTTVPMMDPPLQLTIKDVQADVFQVRCRAGYADIANRKFPNETYTSERFPALIAS